MVGAGLELVFQNDDVLAAEANNYGDFCAGFLECLCRGKCDGTADTAADNTLIVDGKKYQLSNE